MANTRWCQDSGVRARAGKKAASSRSEEVELVCYFWTQQITKWASDMFPKKKKKI